MAWRTESSSAPGRSRRRGLPVPVPMKMASKPRSKRSSTVRSGPMVVPQVMRTPSWRIFCTSPRTTALGRRYSGMPNISTPPGSGSISNISTSKPRRASTPATVRPAGPEPITATRPRSFSTILSWVRPISVSKSATNRSSLPMLMWAPFLPMMQLPSHWRSWAHTRPQTAGRLLRLLMMARAAPRLPMLSSCTQSGISLLMGHALRHWGTLQWRQRLASAIASAMVYPASAGRLSRLSIVGQSTGMKRSRE